MEMIKKFICLLVSVLVIILVSNTVCYGNSEGVIRLVPWTDLDNLAIGDTFKVDVVLENMSSLVGGEIYISFDGHIISIDEKTILDSNMIGFSSLPGVSNVNLIDSENKAILVFGLKGSAKPIDGTYTLSTLTFNLLSNGYGSISIESGSNLVGEDTEGRLSSISYSSMELHYFVKEDVILGDVNDENDTDGGTGPNVSIGDSPIVADGLPPVEDYIDYVDYYDREDSYNIDIAISNNEDFQSDTMDKVFKITELRDNIISINDDFQLFFPIGSLCMGSELKVTSTPSPKPSLSRTYNISSSNPLLSQFKLSFKVDDLDSKCPYGIYRYNENNEKWVYQGGFIEDEYISAWVSNFGSFRVLEDRNYIEFTDIENSWAREYIQFLNSMGIINGLPDKSFNPNGNITRAEIAKVLSLAMDLHNSERADSKINSISFIDSSSIPSWAYDSVENLYTRGVIGGYKDNSFRPNNNVTRAELTSMISRCLMNFISVDQDFDYTAFSDDEHLPHWAKNDIYLIRSLGIISGYVDGSFRPNDNITRSEACKIIFETLKVLNVI